MPRKQEAIQRQSKRSDTCWYISEQCLFRSSCPPAQSYPSLHKFIEYSNNLVYRYAICEQYRSLSGCMEGHADLDLYCLEKPTCMCSHGQTIRTFIIISHHPIYYGMQNKKGVINTTFKAPLQIIHVLLNVKP